MHADKTKKTHEYRSNNNTKTKSNSYNYFPQLINCIILINTYIMFFKYTIYKVINE